MAPTPDQAAIETAAELAATAALKSRDDWRQRWMLSLAVGNGAGAVGMTSALVSTNSALHAGANLQVPILDGLWFFAIGLIVAGAAPFFEQVRYDQLGNYHTFIRQHEKAQRSAQSDYVYVDTLWSLQKAAWRKSEMARLAVGLLQWLGSAFFACGVLFPLALITPAP